VNPAIKRFVFGFSDSQIVVAAFRAFGVLARTYSKKPCEQP
jgi:hypothetical protein